MSGFSKEYRCTGCGSTIKWTILRPLVMVVAFFNAIWLIPILSFSSLFWTFFAFGILFSIMFLVVYYIPGVYALKETGKPNNVPAVGKAGYKPDPTHEGAPIKTYKPDRKKVLILYILILSPQLLFFLITKEYSLFWLIIYLIPILVIGIVFFLYSKERPTLRILDSGSLEYTAPHGKFYIMHFENIKNWIFINSIVKGRYLKVHYQIDDEKCKVIKIVASLFNKRDVVEIIKHLQSQVPMERNAELNQFLMGSSGNAR